MLFRYPLLLMGLFFFSLSSLSLGAELTIQVFQKGSSKTISHAEIHSDGKTLYTDKNGELKLPMPENDLSVFRPGFKEASFTKAEIQGPVFQVRLLPAQPDDNKIVIRGEKKKEVSAKVISIEEAKEIAPNGDPTQVTKFLPGVLTQLFSPNLIIRGSAPENSAYYIDGYEVPFIYHSIGQIAIIPEQFIEDIKFQAGGFGPEYGNATGGVVEIKSYKKVATERKTNISVNIPFDSGFFHEQPIDENSSLTASFRRSYLDVFLKPFLKNTGAIIVPYFADGHISYFKKTETGYQKVLGLYATDHLLLEIDKSGSGSATENGMSFDMGTDYGLLGVEQQVKVNETESFNINPSVLYTNVVFDFGTNYVDVRQNSFTAPFEWQTKLSKKARRYLGVSAVYNVGSVNINIPRVSGGTLDDIESAPMVRTESKFANTSSAGWAAQDVEIGDLTVTPGVRAFTNSVIKDQDHVDPRVSAFYSLSPQRRLKGSVGKYSRNPQPQFSDKNFGNPAVLNEKVNQHIIGWEEDWNDSWNTDVQVYYNIGRDIVETDPVARYLNTGKTKSYGLELFIRRNLTDRAFGWLSYSLSRTLEKASAQDVWLNSTYDHKHIVNLVTSYKFTGQWTLSGRLLYQTGARYTPVDHAVYSDDTMSYSPRYGANATNSGTLTPYNELDLFSTYDILYDQTTLKLRTGVQYLSLVRPVYQVSYNYDYTKTEFLEGLPPIPYIELSADL